VSPVGLSAAIHLGLAISNFGIHEYMRHAPATHEVFRTSYEFAGGMLNASEQPGLGVEYDDEAASAFPYEAAYLPVNRLRDGTMHDW
jgi:mannonate dehydratase